MTRKWTRGNKDIDHCIIEFQLRIIVYEEMIEWNPFDRLILNELIGKGGFGAVYSATWSDGIRKIKKQDDHFVKSRDPYSIVALKTCQILL
ncbi:hypothetical protein C2G38_1174476 [Gigaspora rosea]|uniref:Protein kinase domain-containing protein n=1 Tax=Gigaspora rosea TaxID=44941 RepID=A0A397VF84_9GLOM|nr:hypothetical protein C2G38_1174476 [Gigaspora rosea]